MKAWPVLLLLGGCASPYGYIDRADCEIELEPAWGFIECLSPPGLELDYPLRPLEVTHGQACD